MDASLQPQLGATDPVIITESLPRLLQFHRLQPLQKFCFRSRNCPQPLLLRSLAITPFIQWAVPWWVLLLQLILPLPQVVRLPGEFFGFLLNLFHSI